MRLFSKGSMVLMIALFLTMALAVGCTGKPAEKAVAEKGVTDTTITVGYIGDMTGPITGVTVPFRRAIENYFKYINEQGGVNGRTIKYITEDDKYKVPEAVAAFRKLTTQDQVFALVGQAGSSQVMALTEEIKKEGIPVVGPQQTIDEQLKNQYFFNLLATYEDQAKVIIDYILKEAKAKGLEKPKVATVTIDVASGYEWANYMKTYLQKQGLELASHLTLPAAATEATTQVQKLLEIKPDYIVIHGHAGTTVPFLKDAQRYGLKVPVISSYGGFGDNIYKAVGEAGKRYIGVHSFNPSYFEGEGLKEMVRITQKYGDPKDMESYSYTQGFTVAKVFVEALKRAGRNLTRESLMKALESIQNWDTGGLSAPVTFGPGDHHGIDAVRFFTWDYEKNQMKALTDWMAPAK